MCVGGLGGLQAEALHSFVEKDEKGAMGQCLTDCLQRTAEVLQGDAAASAAADSGADVQAFILQAAQQRREQMVGGPSAHVPPHPSTERVAFITCIELFARSLARSQTKADTPAPLLPGRLMCLRDYPARDAARGQPQLVVQLRPICSQF